MHIVQSSLNRISEITPIWGRKPCYSIFIMVRQKKISEITPIWGRKLKYPHVPIPRSHISEITPIWGRKLIDIICLVFYPDDFRDNPNLGTETAFFVCQHFFFYISEITPIWGRKPNTSPKSQITASIISEITPIWGRKPFGTDD